MELEGIEFIQNTNFEEVLDEEILKQEETDHDIDEKIESAPIEKAESTADTNEKVEIVTVGKTEIGDSKKNWLDELFPDKISKRFLDDEDVISKKTSELRIIWFQIALACFGSLIVLLQIGFLYDKIHVSSPKIFEPKITKINQFERGFPVLHLATINIKGEVKDISMKQEKSSTNLFKLPNNHIDESVGYFGYSDSNGILYIFDQRLIHKVTKYHKSFNHQTIQGSSIYSKATQPWANFGNNLISYKHGFEIGKVFWICGKLNFWGEMTGGHSKIL